MEKTPTQELSDILYGLQVQCKVIEDLLEGAVNGHRTAEDFEMRFHNQAWLLTDQLKKVKPLVETTIQKGYSFFRKEEVQTDVAVLTE